ncbi:MAG: YbhB/YbcL family Raf kinase inhibitor-like protein [Anaerolineales bacterium]
MNRSWLCAALVLLIAACVSPSEETEAPEATHTEFVLLTETMTPEEPTEDFTLTSPAFAEGDAIPDRFACTGANLSPELLWSGVPAGTQGFALIFDDPDASGGSWVHWIVYGIPSRAAGLPQGAPRAPTLGNGTVHGANSWGTLDYGGPCPPPGSPHRYVFTLYALDLTLELEPGASKSELLAAMEGHILAQAELTGTFGR